MPSAKQRGSKGGHGAASPSEKGAHPSGGADDVAKKPPPAPQQHPPPPAPHPQQQHPPQHPQNQAHGKGGHRGGKSSSSAAAAAASSSASCSRRLGRVLNFLFYLALVAAAAFSGWCVHHVLEEVQHVRRSHQDFSRQREELGQGLQGVEQKVGTQAPDLRAPGGGGSRTHSQAPSCPPGGGPRRPRPGVLRQRLGIPSPRPFGSEAAPRPSLLMAAEESARGMDRFEDVPTAWEGGPRACHRTLAVTCKEAGMLWGAHSFWIRNR